MSSPAERRGIKISLIGASTFAIVGLSFALWSQSQAVLLDGAFNLITALIVLFAKRVTRLLGEPESRHRPAGYVALEPLYVLIKGVVLLILTLVVMASNAIILLTGGAELELGPIVIYIAVAVAGNATIWLLIRRQQREATSPLLDVEVQNWQVNTLISAGIGLSFLLVLLFEDGALKPIVPYVDQIIVLVVGLLALPVPATAIRTGLKELLLFGADEPIQARTEEILAETMSDAEVKRWKVNVIKTGRVYWVAVFVDPTADTTDADFGDRLQAALLPTLEAEYSPTNLEVMVSRRDDYWQ